MLVVSAGVGAAFVARERRAAHPLIDLSLLRPRAVSFGLVGALCAYLVLFGPLALFPQLFHTHGASAGLVLTALPAGFALAALTAERVVPSRPRARGLAGAVACVAAAGALAVAPSSPVWVAAWLALLGLGLGVFIPSNNHAIMGAIPARASATGGGLVNMGRGLGTALGVAAVTFSLHVTRAAGVVAGARLALGVLAAFALVAVATAVVDRERPTPG